MIDLRSFKNRGSRRLRPPVRQHRRRFLFVPRMLPTAAFSPSEALGDRMEEIMASFLEQSHYRQEPAASDLSEDLQERLRALGYLE